MNDSDFLYWLAARLINVYKESQFTDFVLKTQEIAEKLKNEKNKQITSNKDSNEV